MTNSHEKFKQDVLRDSALNEVQHTIETFESLEHGLDHLLDVELSQLETQYNHLLELSGFIDDDVFKTQLQHFADNRLKVRRLRIKTLLVLSRESTVNAREILATLNRRQSNLKED